MWSDVGSGGEVGLHASRINELDSVISVVWWGLLDEPARKFIEKRHVGRNPTPVAKTRTSLDCLAPMLCGDRKTVIKVFTQRTSRNVAQSLQFLLRGLPTVRSALICPSCRDSGSLRRQFCNCSTTRRWQHRCIPNPPFSPEKNLPLRVAARHPERRPREPM